jgi:2-polyprenyl-3-methyl-5-hydroxy-6-metoxy-1,4-benzoquinol methylase
MSDPKFAFGRNWQRYLGEHFSPEKLAVAQGSLADFCGGAEALRGRTFLDIGCGSGIFSLAAFRLGASRIVSLDIDPDSVACCRRLREDCGAPPSWEVLQGSVLDDRFLQELGTFDWVYSWGVLHHTGAMWQAISNAAAAVAPGGRLFLAIYNEADGWGLHPDGRFGPSRFWLWEKRAYCRLPAFLQAATVYVSMACMVALYLLTLRNPARMIREHARRGQNWEIDIRDWLGGYPYEFARADAVFLFLLRRGFALENLRVNNGLLNNEYLFRKLPGQFPEA